MSNSKGQQEKQSVGGNNRLAVKLLVGTLAMFGFGFALVPLYDVFCDITGLNGKTGGQYTQEVDDAAIDESRTITVQFVTRNNAGMSWDFRPEVKEVQVHPGELAHVNFYARNPEGHEMIGQAIPSVAPSRAAEYLRKTECFCFNQQVLSGGEDVSMPLYFFVDKALPDNVNKLTLSYSMFDVTENFSGRSLSQNAN